MSTDALLIVLVLVIVAGFVMYRRKAELYTPAPSSRMCVSAQQLGTFPASFAKILSGTQEAQIKNATNACSAALLSPHGSSLADTQKMVNAYHSCAAAAAAIDPVAINNAWAKWYAARHAA